MHPNHREVEQLPEEARVEVAGNDVVGEASDIVEVADNDWLHEADNPHHHRTEEPDWQRRQDCVENSGQTEVGRRFWEVADEALDPGILHRVVTLESTQSRFDPGFLSPPVEAVIGVACEPVRDVLIPADSSGEDAVCAAPQLRADTVNGSAAGVVTDGPVDAVLEYCLKGLEVLDASCFECCNVERRAAGGVEGVDHAHILPTEDLDDVSGQVGCCHVNNGSVVVDRVEVDAVFAEKLHHLQPRVSRALGGDWRKWKLRVFVAVDLQILDIFVAFKPHRALQRRQPATTPIVYRLSSSTKQQPQSFNITTVNRDVDQAPKSRSMVSAHIGSCVEEQPNNSHVAVGGRDR